MYKLHWLCQTLYDGMEADGIRVKAWWDFVREDMRMFYPSQKKYES